MANLRIENNLSGGTTTPPDFLYRIRGSRWKRIKPGSSPIDEAININGQYFFCIDGSPAENNSIVIAYKDCSHCVEILYLKSGNEINVFLRFIPMTNISNDIEVKAIDIRPQSAHTSPDNQDVYVLNQYYPFRRIFSKKNGSPVYNPSSPIPENTPYKIDTIVETDVYEFRADLQNVDPSTAESCRYLVVMKGKPYTLIISENRRIEVSIYYDNPHPGDINITILPD